MKNTMSFVLGILIAMTLAGCPNKPTPTPSPDSGSTPSATVYEAACANLITWGCSEGLADNCVETLQKTQERGLVDMKPSCLASAKSVGDVQACGSVECVSDASAKAAATCDTSCANLKKIGCKEGADTTCVATCQKTVAKQLVKVPLACFSRAKTKAVARSCGGIDCL